MASMKPVRSFLVVVACAVLVGTSACSSDSSTGKSGSTTEVVTVTPLDESGEPRPDYLVEHNMKDLDCEFPSPSAVDLGVVQCGSNAHSADVCWVKQDQLTVLCGTSPWDMTLREFYSATPIQEMKVEYDPVPWAMELDDGGKCRRRIGGALNPLPFDLAVAYYCKGTGGDIVTGPKVKLINKSSDKWSVQIMDTQKAEKAGDSYQLPPRRSVVKAYFAGQSA